MTKLAFPYGFDARRRTADADHAAYVRGLVHQLLFTGEGERVNRPGLDCGLRELVFDGISEALRAAVELKIAGALQQYLSDYLSVEEIQVEQDDSRLEILVRYRLNGESAVRSERFAQES